MPTKREVAVFTKIIAKIKKHAKAKLASTDTTGGGETFNTLETEPSWTLRNPTTDDESLVMSTGFFIYQNLGGKGAGPVFEDGKLYVPAWPHSHHYNLEGNDKSFTQFKTDSRLHGFARGTGAFIGPNTVLTARHLFVDFHIHQRRIWFVMNAAFWDPSSDPQAPYKWKTTPRDPKFGEELEYDSYLEIDEKFVLSVKPPLAGSEHKASNGADWLVLEVEARPGVATIPKREQLCLASAPWPAETGITVPGHPRGLPLKVAEGAALQEATDDIGFAWFDVAGGTSGAPWLVCAPQHRIISVQSGRTFDHYPDGADQPARAHVCEQQNMSVDPKDDVCRLQPGTSIDYIRSQYPAIAKFDCNTPTHEEP